MAFLWSVQLNPLNILIFIANAYLLYLIVRRIRGHGISCHVSPIPEMKEYTRATWKQLFISSPSPPLWIAVQGNIYDVSSAPQFYAKGGAYEMFTGHDCTLAFAKNSF